MSDDNNTKTTNTTRRKALKAIGVGGVLAGTIPGSWTKPVVKSIVLPAHAQTSGCGPLGPCTSGMNVSILSAVRTGGGDLIVIGDTPVPGNCLTADSSDGPMLCEVLDCNGDVLPSNGNRTIAGGDCSVDGASVTGCLVSCSVFISAGNNTLASGDDVTLRLTFNGVCVCSGVSTVS